MRHREWGGYAGGRGAQAEFFECGGVKLTGWSQAMVGLETLHGAGRVGVPFAVGSALIGALVG